MERDTELTAFLLRYLHDNHYFRSIEEMAEVLDISKRQLQRLLNSTDSLKGGSIVLSKVLQYFSLHHIPLDPILEAFMEKERQKYAGKEIQLDKPYQRIYLPIPSGTNDEQMEAYEYCKECIGIISSYICPSCTAWCNPWDGTDKLQGQHCFIARLARTLLQSVADVHPKKA